MRYGGIFNGSVQGLGMFGLGDVQQDMITFCKNNCAVNFPEKTAAQCASECTAAWPQSKIDTYTKCATTCKSYRPDTPEWAQCIQKCQGYPPVNYDAEKAKCKSVGKEYSWLEGGCVDPAKFNGCPAGTMYASYPDGSEKCIGYSSDLTSTKCPPGTSLKTVPGGSTCVSPVPPGGKVSTPKPPAPRPTVTTTPPTEPAKAGFVGIPTIGWLGLAAVAGIIGIAVMAKKKKQEGPSIPARMARTSVRRNALQLKPGYSFKYEGAKWFQSPDDDWEIGIYPTYRTKHIGVRHIDGAPVNVFKSMDEGSPVYYAQSLHQSR